MRNKSDIQYFDQDGVPYLINVGSKILSLLNGVKHTVASFSELHGLDSSALEAVVKSEFGPTQKIREAIESHCPLRVRDLYPKDYRDKFPIPDDTVGGIRVCTAEETRKTQRKMFRGPEGKRVLFYTYADTAMSATSLFRPEWIAEHFVYDSEHPKSVPDWAFNHGHFEHQITYFIGPVNFHWISDGKKYVRPMNTGDVNYIAPFVPHTFTTREEGKGLILAITYGGAAAGEAYQSKIQEISVGDYLSNLATGAGRLPEIKEVLATDELGGVMVKHHEYARRLGAGAYELISGVPFQSRVRALKFNLSGGAGINRSVDVERWGYNIGNTTLVLYSLDSVIGLNPGDSFFIRPEVKHCFGGRGKVLIMEIDPEGGDPLQELALIKRYSGIRGLERVRSENTQWF